MTSIEFDLSRELIEEYFGDVIANVAAVLLVESQSLISLARRLRNYRLLQVIVFKYQMGIFKIDRDQDPGL